MVRVVAVAVLGRGEMCFVGFVMEIDERVMIIGGRKVMIVMLMKVVIAYRMHFGIEAVVRIAGNEFGGGVLMMMVGRIVGGGGLMMMKVIEMVIGIVKGVVVMIMMIVDEMMGTIMHVVIVIVR